MTTLTRFALHLAAVLPSLCVVACSGRSDITIGNGHRDSGSQGSSDGTAGSGGSDQRPPAPGGGAGVGTNTAAEDAGTSGMSGSAGSSATDASPGLEDAGNGDEEASGPVYPPGNPTGKSSAPGFFTDGFLRSGPWGGYVFTYADSVGSTITPTCGSPDCTRTREGQPCAKGTVVPQMDGTPSYVGLGFHVNEPKNGGKGAWPVNGSGLLLSVTNPPPGARISLQERNGQDNNQRYCAFLPEGGSGTIPWSEFKTWCWGDDAHPSVALRQGTQLEEAAIVIPGAPDQSTDFEFCLINIAPQQ